MRAGVLGTNRFRSILVLVSSAVLAFAVIAAANALADPGHRQDGVHGHHGHKGNHGDNGKGHGKNKPKMYVFRGIYNADGSVNVTSGNGRVRKHGFVGQTVTFDYTSAKFSAADGPDADAVGNEQSDVIAGDTVLVQAKLGREDPGAQPFKAKRLNDLTRPPVQPVQV
jgi:hypothetical protein